MAARETKPNGKSQLIRDLKNGEFATLYIISGEESYMKEYREEILSDVMASDIRFDEVKGYTKEWSINGEQVTLGVEKR